MEIKHDKFHPLDEIEMDGLKVALSEIPVDKWDFDMMKRLGYTVHPSLPDYDDIALICGMPIRERRMVDEIERLREFNNRQAKLLNILIQEYIGNKAE